MTANPQQQPPRRHTNEPALPTEATATQPMTVSSNTSWPAEPGISAMGKRASHCSHLHWHIYQRSLPIRLLSHAAVVGRGVPDEPFDLAHGYRRGAPGGRARPKSKCKRRMVLGHADCGKWLPATIHPPRQKLSWPAAASAVRNAAPAIQNRAPRGIGCGRTDEMPAK
jgi:hypothetical protein